MARPGTTEPDLVGELRKLQGRLDALERKPVPQSIYDRYPATESQAPGRPRMRATSGTPLAWPT